jgi:hypothetical protein
MTKGRVVLHVPLHMAAQDGSALPGFLRKLRDGFVARGAAVDIRHRNVDALASMGDTPDFHIVHNGRVRHRRALNSGLAYLYPFWYLDPQGVFFEASTAEASFDPDSAYRAESQDFFDRLSRRHLTQRQSRYGQPQDRRVFPAGQIAFFLQGASDPSDRARHMAEDQIFDALVAARGNRGMIVKPHPRNTDPVMHTLAERAARTRGVTVTDANVHDILAATAVTISVASATALEGMLHRVPAVLCGRSDLHHCAETAIAPEGIADALGRARDRAFPFEAFLYWFLGQQMLNAGSDRLIENALARIKAQGADLAELGMATG